MIPSSLSLADLTVVFYPWNLDIKTNHRSLDRRPQIDVDLERNRQVLVVKHFLQIVFDIASSEDAGLWLVINELESIAHDGELSWPYRRKLDVTTMQTAFAQAV